MKKNVSRLFAAVLGTAMLLNGCAYAGTGLIPTNPGAALAEVPDTSKAAGVEGAVVNTKALELVEEEVPMYYLSAEDERSIKLYFADEDHEIPYINEKTVKELLQSIYHDVDLDDGFAVDVATEGHTATFTRENRYTMELDCDADTIRFLDYDAFFMPSYSPTVIDVLEHYGTIPCLEVVDNSSYSRYGSEVCFDLKSYGIDLIEKDGVCYMPVQTFSDLATSLSSYVIFLYNGEALFVDEYGSDREAALLAKYYEVKSEDGKRSEALAAFNYQELCMTLDYCYGLARQHNITGFDAFFDETGLKRRLLGEDAVESSKALFDLTMLYLSDGHSAYNGNSYRIGEDSDTFGSLGRSYSELALAFQEYGEARKVFYPDGVPGYEEIGNTAYITFDSFKTMPSDADYYNDPPTSDTTDTVGICLYAFSQIKRDGSPVENVVLDLSRNGGGDSTTASFVLSMFLGEASICVEDTLTGAYMSESFHCDANLDKKFDEEDSLRGYRLFCLTSPCSFSCGNLVPSVLQNSKRVKTVGMESGGGACIVMPITTADGTRLQLSGFRRLGYMKNGSVYDIDQGVEPDYAISTVERFYDRKALTEYINGLY